MGFDIWGAGASKFGRVWELRFGFRLLGLHPLHLYLSRVAQIKLLAVSFLQLLSTG